MNNPFFVICLLHQMVKFIKFVLLTQMAFEAVQELAFEQGAQLKNRVQKGARFTYVFPFAFERIPGSRHNAVDMGVQTQVLPPRLNDISRAGRYAERILHRFQHQSAYS